MINARKDFIMARMIRAWRVFTADDLDQIKFHGILLKMFTFLSSEVKDCWSVVCDLQSNIFFLFHSPLCYPNKECLHSGCTDLEVRHNNVKESLNY